MDKNSNNNWSLLICLALTLAAAAVFCRVCTYDFVNYDDPFVYVYENPNIQAGITPKAIKWAFTTGYACFWHPLTWLSHMRDWQLFGPNAGGHHLTNLIFHIANTLLLFIVLKQMTHTLWPSAFVAALFALHPLHVESVAWVSERKDVLSTFFWILTMLAYVRYVSRPKIANYLLVVIFFALGLMSKPMLVTLPFVLLLLDYWPLDRLGPGVSPRRGKTGSKHSLSYLLIEKIPLFAMTTVSCIATFIAQKRGGVMHLLKDCGLFIRLANASISYMQYIIKMIWPARLAFFYPHPSQSVSVLYAAVSTAFLLTVTIFILRFAKERRYLVTGWFWYLGTLVPVIGFVQVGSQAMADRYSYITLTGLFIIIAWGLPDLLGKWPYRKIVLRASSLVVLSVLAICTYLQQQCWKDTITLCQHALKVTKNNYSAHFGMAQPLLEQGRIEEAIWHYSETLRIRPDYVEALNNLGIALYKAGRVDEAIGYYKRAIEINPRDIEVYSNLGMALAAKGKFDEAISLYNKALQIAPDLIDIHLNLGFALTGSGKLEDAVKEYEKILLIQPQNAVAHNDFGVVLFRQGKFDEAIAHFKQAIQIDPNYTAARDNLNLALAEKQKPQNKDTENTQE
jgi:tetratricopeptide (TPR) repeat protein